jgi:probable HAF family extracellular repeat protein
MRIGTLSTASTSIGYDITDNGLICGDAYPADAYNTHAFLYDKGNKTDLGALVDGGSSFAAALNSSGQVVGKAGTSDGSQHAFLWRNNKMIDLGTLPGGRYSYATGINGAGQVVGWGNSVGDRAFIWENEQMTNLNTLISPSAGWTLVAAYGINNNGQIVGAGIYDYTWHSFLLTPVPEPSSLLALFSGIAGLGMKFRRKSAK